MKDAEEIARNIRMRHDGRNRSPWNEPECGLLYSRQMGGWNLLDQACGFQYDSTKASVQFDPRYSPKNFSCFFVAEAGWGEYRQKEDLSLEQHGIDFPDLEGCEDCESPLDDESIAGSKDMALKNGKVEIKLLHGHLRLKHLKINTRSRLVTASLVDTAGEGRGVDARIEKYEFGSISFGEGGVTIAEGETLKVDVSVTDSGGWAYLN